VNGSALYCPDSQRSILGSLLLDNGLMGIVELTPEDFSGTPDRAIYQVMLDKWAEGEPFDPVTIAASLNGQLDSFGGVAYLGTLIDGAVADAGLIKANVKIVRDSFKLRRLAWFAEDLAKRTGDPKANPEHLIAKVEKVISSLRSDCHAQPSRLPELLKLSDVEARDVAWLWQPYLALGMLGMLSGDPGAGKTWISMAIAAALTVGRVPYSGQQCEPMHVLYLSVENSPEYVLRPRFDRLEGDSSRFHILRGSISSNGRNPAHGSVKLSDIQLLHDSLQKTKARLLIVDPIQSYLGADVDAHRSNETRPVLDGLARLAEEHHACILLVRHFAKSPTGRAIHRGLGSIDLTGAVRTELHAGTVDDQRAMAQAKSNLGQLGKSLGYAIEGDGSFRWTGESEFTAGDFQEAESNSEQRTDIEMAREYLQVALANGAVRVKELEAGTEIHPRTLRRASKKLEVKRTRDGENGPFLWALR